MRIIARKTLVNFWKKYPDSEQSLKSWFDEAKKAEWKNPNEVKQQYNNASVISGKRIIFNIKGNDYRLIVDIEFRLKIIFIVWIGTHEDYNKINARTIKYDQAD
jgi:mRNA interferase HigB